MSTHETTLLFQGDSITDVGRSRQDTESHSPFALGAGYAKIVAARLLCEAPEKHWRIFNRGVSGNRVVDLYARTESDILSLQPDILSILIGVNDTGARFFFGNGISVAKYEKIYRLLLAECKDHFPHIRFLLGEPFVLPGERVTTEWFGEIEERQEVVHRLASEFDAKVIPFGKTFKEALERAPADYWSTDGIHPTAAGHYLMAETWWKSFQALPSKS
ncbi:MAG: SGNH/GDSL hydrolase family protein [Opitutales bacterium]|nr:SGNH/GDSL hydrolase family protein [Opitutales bacterium]